MLKRWLLCRIVVLLMVFGNPVQSSTIQKKLERNLFTHYDRNVLPSHKGHTIILNIAFQINQIEFDEVKGFLTVTAHIVVEWEDPKLNWKPSEYANISKMHLIGREVWLPDLSLYNSIGNKALDVSDNGVTWLEHTGLVSWSMRARLQTLCELDMFRWPYDTHKCELKLGSWTHDGLQVDLFPTDKSPIVMEFTENPEFSVTNFTRERRTTFYDCCSEPYVTLEYFIEFTRRSSAFASVFLTPAFCVVILTLSAFWLPPQRGEKILMNGVTLIVITIYILYFVKNLSSFSLRIPLIVVFYCISFILVSISMIISVLVLASARSLCKGHLPPGLAKLLKSRIGVIFAPSDDSKKPDQTELSHHFEDGKSHETHSLIRINNFYDEWTSLGIILDRVSFVVYSGVFILLGLVCYL